MKKALLLIGIILCVSNIVLAAPKNKNDAKKVVRGWLKQTQGKHLDVPLGQAIERVDTFSDSNDVPIYHIVYLDSSGFVIVPADDYVEPIIGFSSDGQYVPSIDNPLGALVTRDLPDRIQQARGVGNQKGHSSFERNKHNLKWSELEYLAEQGDIIPTTHISSPSDVRVSPLVQSVWDQSIECGSNCYNIYTPNNSVCGCVATAMAQLMRFYQHPANPNGAQPFQIWVNGVSQNNFLRGGDGNGGNYDWSNMVLDPTCSITNAQRQAIAALTYDAGVASHMQYSASSSGAWMNDAQDALLNVFSYSNVIHGGTFHSSSNIGTGLCAMVNPNLDAGYPVLFAIYRTDGAHAIVCDGYGYDNSVLYHHLNMGWGESNSAQNVWYDLPNINSSPFAYTTISVCLYNIYTTGKDEIISGRITDSNGNAISGTIVSATKKGGGSYTATTNSKGIYALTKVPANSLYTVTASKSGYNFTSRTVNTGTSTDFSVTAGNVWGADFTAGSTPTNHDPILSNPRVSPSSGTTLTNFEFLVDYYDPDGDPPHADYKKVYISGQGGGNMTLKSGTAANGTYRYSRTLPTGIYSYSFFFADTNNGYDSLDGPSYLLVHNPGNCIINISIYSPYVNEDLKLEYSLNGIAGPFTSIPITSKDLQISVPSGSQVTFTASTSNPNYEYDSWGVMNNGVYTEGTTNVWTIQTMDDSLDLDVTYHYIPQYYTISGTVLLNNGSTVPGGVTLTLTSPEQALSQVTTNGSWSFTDVKGGIPTTITPTATGAYDFGPPSLVFTNLEGNKTGQAIIAYASDFTVPKTSLVNVPPIVSENSSISFSWIGSDNVTVPANLQYQYKLDGVDADWSAWSSDTAKTYDVNNGVYTFWVHAKDEAGNINQVPANFKVVVNAAPRIASAERINNSVWASRITLEMPQGASHPTDAFILLPQHAVINDVELIPVSIHPVNDINTCGANTIIASQLGLTGSIKQALSGWTVTLPQTIPAGQTIQYDITWGKIKYFGWNEYVNIPVNFETENVNVQDKYLAPNFNMWRMATKNVTLSSTYGDTKSWTFLNITNPYGPVMPQTTFQFIPGIPFNGTYGERYTLQDGDVIQVGPNIFTVAGLEKNTKTKTGSTTTYGEYEGFAFAIYGIDGTPITSNQSPTWFTDSDIRWPLYTAHNRLYITGSTSTGSPWVGSAWFMVYDSMGNAIIPTTTIESATKTNLSVSRLFELGSNVLFLIQRGWTVNSDYYRQSVQYQIRNQAGDLVQPTVTLSPALMSDSYANDDYYMIGSAIKDQQGKIWITLERYTEGSSPTDRTYYMILGTNGTIEKGPIETTLYRSFNFCDQDGLIWSSDNSGEITILNPDDTIAYGPRSVVFAPNHQAGTATVGVDANGYRLYDRWSPQIVQIDVPENANVSSIELYDTDLWNLSLHTSNLALKKSENTIWTQGGQFTGHTIVDVSDYLVVGQNVLTLTQDDFVGGQILVTFPYTLPTPNPDIDRDGKVNLVDFNILSTKWMLTPYDPKWFDRADIDHNDSVDLSDLIIMAGQWLEVTIPNVIGMSQADAQTAIINAGLIVGTVTEEFSNTISQGYVINHTPSSGHFVVLGSVVNLVVSKGPAPVIVPDVTGMSQAEAETAIATAGLIIGSVTEEFSDTIPSGDVISQNPPAGTEVSQGSTVNLVISKGSIPSDIVWISINDPGVSGHESYIGQMSKYETTNFQYCQFLNASLASGDITVGTDGFVYGATGANGGDDFVGQMYYDLAGSGYTYNGAINGGAARINWTGSTFTVDSGFQNHPVTYVSWYGATAFCNYYGYRLPTQWEWQAIADYDGSYTYGCGTYINNSVANYLESNHPYGTTAVGSFGGYGYGMCDMSGNAGEWTSTTAPTGMITMGGVWLSLVEDCKVNSPGVVKPEHLFHYMGFRVCRVWVVPDVTGMSQTEAEATIINAGLVLGNVFEAYSTTIAQGNVISQNPSGGQSVWAGSAVSLVVSKGPAPVIVPNVTGMPQAEAEVTIITAGLVVGTATEQYSDTIALGNVISQTPPAGIEALEGSTVNLVISKGNDPSVIVWVSIADSGVSGHEGFVGKMSKYETTNAQYCHFLDVALASGDIIVNETSGLIYGANGSNGGVDFVGKVYYNLTGAGRNFNGAAQGGAARINYIDGEFTVDSGFENHPVTYVTWYGAMAFCNYFGYRLPTEWEWQAVADYDGTYTYGCGTTIDNSMANYLESLHTDGTRLVGSFGTYGYGMCDMSGNVGEWTSTVVGAGGVTRGGTWLNVAEDCSVYSPGIVRQEDPFYYLGFRACH